jgi:hypothetical protein
MDNVAATFAMGVNDPAPAILDDSTAIARTTSLKREACQR